MGSRVIAVRRIRLVVEYLLGVLVVAGIILEQPDRDDLIRIMLKIVALEMFNRPADRSLANGFDLIRRAIAYDDERASMNSLKPSGSFFFSARMCCA